MFEDEPSEDPANRPIDPNQRADEKSAEFRMHAQLAAVFEACRKFDAEINPSLDPDLAREIQRKIGRMEKSKHQDHPILMGDAIAEAAEVLTLPTTRDISTNDYHIYRRPGETMIVRWLAGDEVETFYERMQAHFDAALTHFRNEERQANEWKQDPKTLAYLEALDAIEIKMAERYLRDPIRQHKLFVLSTQTADEMDILHLSDFLMGVAPEQVVGEASAPPDAPTEQDRAWFFKLFTLRGMDGDTEQMCFFTYMQKADDTFDW